MPTEENAPKPRIIDERIETLIASLTAMRQKQTANLQALTQPIDQRLERLTDRQEALTQTVEMLALENRQMAIDNRQRDKRLHEIMEGIASLLHVAEIRRTPPLKPGRPALTTAPRGEPAQARRATND
jgi:hypothetical protein